MGSQQVFIGFTNFYRRSIQGFSRIVISLTAILKTTGSSVASAFEVDDDEVGGGGAGAESGGSVVKRKVGLIAPTKVEELLKNLKGLKDLKNLQRLSVRRNVYRSTGRPSTKNSSFR